MKQTAIEYLIEQLPFRIKNQFFSELKKAKAIEQQQIIDAATWGGLCETGEQYYNLKYNLKLKDIS